VGYWMLLKWKCGWTSQHNLTSMSTRSTTPISAHARATS